MNLSWKNIKENAILEGTNLDIYIKNTKIKDWNNFVTFIKKYDHDFSINGKQEKIVCKVEKSFFNSKDIYYLGVLIGNIRLNCNFFTQLEIELFFDPSQILSIDDFNELLSFMKEIGNSLEKNVFLTPENCPNIPLIKFIQKKNNFEY